MQKSYNVGPRYNGTWLYYRLGTFFILLLRLIKNLYASLRVLVSAFTWLRKPQPLSRSLGLRLRKSLVGTPHLSSAGSTHWGLVMLCYPLALGHQYIPRIKEVERGIYWFNVVCPSVCLSIRLWTVCIFNNTFRIHFVFTNLNFRRCVTYKVFVFWVFFSKFQNFNFWQIFQICHFDFVMFWLGIQYESIVRVIVGWWGVFSECRHSSRLFSMKPLPDPMLLYKRVIGGAVNGGSSLINYDNPRSPLQLFIDINRVSSGQGKVREIPDLAKVREKSGNFVEGQGKK